METAVVPAPANALVEAAPPPTGLGPRLAAMPTRTLVGAALGVVLLVAVLVAMAFSLRTSDHKVLFSNLSEKDGAVVIAKLDQLGVDYKFADGGGSILVPASRVYELRMKLSAAGVNKGSISGYELLDGNSSFGQSDGQQRVQLKRALEGELTRTIQTLQSVQAARVMLAMPQQNGFFRDQQKPTASVTVQMHPGRTLEREQVAGIVHLVASSVPELNTKAVSVVDGNGALLWPQDDRNGAQGFDSAQLRYLKEVEASHLKRVMDLLEPVVGRENLRATVTAEVDFSQVESTAEEFKPNQGDAPATVRATRTEESTQTDPNKPSGVPGAATNQPPVPATAPINGASAPLQGAQAGVAGSNRREAETKYEVDRVVRMTRNATGTVRRLHAAVVVNHRSSTDPKGKTSTVPLTDPELEKLTSLVQQGIGYNQQRGDSVRVVNAPFRVEAAPPAEVVPFYLQPWVQDLLRAGLAPGALALVALVVVFALIRPAVKAATTQTVVAPTAVGGQLDAVVADDEKLPELTGPGGVPVLEEPKMNHKLEAARALAKENPAAVANIVRNWVSGEAA